MTYPDYRLHIRNLVKISVPSMYTFVAMYDIVLPTPVQIETIKNKYIDKDMYIAMLQQGAKDFYIMTYGHGTQHTLCYKTGWWIFTKVHTVSSFARKWKDDIRIKNERIINTRYLFFKPKKGAAQVKGQPLLYS